jgi:hypothetical protein
MMDALSSSLSIALLADWCCGFRSLSLSLAVVQWAPFCRPHTRVTRPRPTCVSVSVSNRFIYFRNPTQETAAMARGRVSAVACACVKRRPNGCAYIVAGSSTSIGRTPREVAAHDRPKGDGL